MRICKQCNEELEDSFDTCWKCQTPFEGHPTKKTTPLNFTEQESSEQVVTKPKKKNGYVVAVASVFGYSFFKTFYVTYGSYNSAMLRAYNNIYDKLGDTTRLAEVGLADKLLYLIATALGLVLVPLIISALVWFVRKRQNFAGIFGTTTFIWVLIRLALTFSELDDSWFF